MSLKSAGQLFSSRRFWPLFVLFQAGTFNDNVLKNSLIALVTFGGMVFLSPDLPRDGLVAMAALLFTLPFLLLCTIAGQIADKVDRALILKWVKRAEAVIMCVAALGFFLENTYILAFSLLLMGAQSAFFSPTKNAVLPQWLDDKDLITANGLMSGFQFFTILLGMVIGIKLALMSVDSSFWTGPRIVSVIMLIMGLIGWAAAEMCPPAPAPQPNLKVDYNPISSIIGVLKTSLEHMDVFRPMLGIAWFYGFSNILILVLPVFVADVLKYNQDVLTIILVASTLSILVGSLLCLVLARGREALGLVAFGICGIVIFTLDLYLSTKVSSHEGLGDLAAFKAAQGTPRFMIDIIGASVCAGLYVVPLQAMAQRRADPKLRARLMSAGAVLLNAAVNIVTFALIGLSFTSMRPQTPFLAIVLVSLIVAIYTLRRVWQLRGKA